MSLKGKKNTGMRLIGIMLCLSVLTTGMVGNWSPLRDVPVSAKTLDELQQERKANEEKITEKQKELDALQSDLDENEAYQEVLQDKIALQQQNLDIVVEELDRINDSIDETTAAIAETQDEITVMEADIEIGLEEFKLRLRAMYMQGSDSLASALVGATDFYDLLSKYELMSRVAKHDNDLVNGLKADLEACNEKKAQLESEKATLDQQQAEQQAKKDEFTQALADLQDTYSETTEAQEIMQREQDQLNQDVETLEKNNADLEAQEKEIKAAIAAAAEKKRQEEEERKKQEAAAQAQQQQQQQQQQSSEESSSNSSTNQNSNSGSSSDTSDNSTSNENSASENTTQQQPSDQISTGSASFAWPCPGYYVISSGYGGRWGTNHNGIDIAGGNAGAAVTASRSGTVVRVVSNCTHNYAKNSSCGCGGGYGNYVVIQHDGTYSTLYGHMASVAVSVGDEVSQGQTLGYVGSTGFSTGFHLHFEIRVNGSYVDPMQYL